MITEFPNLTWNMSLFDDFPEGRPQFHEGIGLPHSSSQLGNLVGPNSQLLPFFFEGFPNEFWWALWNLYDIMKPHLTSLRPPKKNLHLWGYSNPDPHPKVCRETKQSIALIYDSVLFTWLLMFVIFSSIHSCWRRQFRTPPQKLDKCHHNKSHTSHPQKNVTDIITYLMNNYSTTNQLWTFE